MSLPDAGQDAGDSSKPIDHFLGLVTPEDPSLALSAFSRDSCPRYSLVHQLSDDWFCYWSEEYAVPKDPSINFTFEPRLLLSRAGVVLPGGLLPSLQDSEHSAFMEAVRLARSAALGQGTPLTLDGLGSESDIPIEPFVCRVPPGWPQDRDFSASLEEARAFFSDLLTAMGAHPSMASTVNVHLGQWAALPPAGDKAPDSEVTSNNLLEAICRRGAAAPGEAPKHVSPGRRFAETMGNCAWAVVGEEQLNPVPVLVVKRCNDQFLAGVITAVIYT